MKHLNLTLISLLLSFISFGQAPTPIMGTLTVCTEGVSYLSDGVTGGTWSSSNTITASIDPTSGTLTGGAAGFASIFYTTSGGTVSAVVTVNPIPVPVAGSVPLCEGSTISLTDATTGGTWFSAYAPVADVDPSSGVVTGNGGGTAIIFYELPTGCNTTVTVTVNSTPFVYTTYGGGISCSGTTGVSIYLDGSTPGVSYQLLNGSTLVTIAPGTGSTLFFGPYTSGGTYTIVGASTSTGCSIAMSGIAVISDSLSPTTYTLSVTGGGAYCAGSTGPTISLASSDPGISYQLYRGTATSGAPIIGTGSTFNFGVTDSAGSYSVIAINPASACVSEMADSVHVTINPTPAIFTVGGSGGYCRGTPGLAVTLSGSATGINYQLYDGGVAHGVPLAGSGASLNFGFDTSGVYTVIATNTVTGCTSTMTGSAIISSTLLTPLVTISISPGGVICSGATIGFTAVPLNGGATPAYTWSVNGSAAGTGSTHTYVPANGDVISVLMNSSLPCASPDTARVSQTLVVDVPDITASSSSSCGGFDKLVANGGSTYVWAPASGLACPTCDSIVVNPNSTVVYTLTGTDIYGCIGVTTITANGNRIAGHISGVTTFGSIRVWLLKFSTTDSSLVTIDSTMDCLDDGTPYYEFDNYPAGSYIVQAEVLGGVPGLSGYVPTYGMSSPYWNSSSGIVHSGATDTMHITMLYGIIYSGPCSISGNIRASASPTSFTTFPAENMIVFLQDAYSGNVLTYTYTNSAGQYSFNNIAYGSYIIYPEQYDYYTTPHYVITLNAANNAAGNVNFGQFTSYRVITPFLTNENVKPLSSENGLSVFPNPSNGNLNIRWIDQPTGTANIVITDVVGREAYSSTMNINTISGQTQIDLSGLKDGIYLINVKSTTANYTGKLMIER